MVVVVERGEVVLFDAKPPMSSPSQVVAQARCTPLSVGPRVGMQVLDSRSLSLSVGCPSKLGLGLGF